MFQIFLMLLFTLIEITCFVQFQNQSIIKDHKVTDAEAPILENVTESNEVYDIQKKFI